MNLIERLRLLCLSCPYKLTNLSHIFLNASSHSPPPLPLFGFRNDFIVFLIVLLALIFLIALLISLQLDAPPSTMKWVF